MFTSEIIVVDLEATCWEGKPYGNEVSEIIEIGICILNIKSGDIRQNQGILVQPTKSRISPFCTKLTTITPDLIQNEGISFKDACNLIRAEYNSYDYIWASYGDYDFNMFTKQCKLRNIDFPLSHKHINVKELFRQTKGLKKKLGMNGALETLKIPLEGTHHRGIDDAKNIAKILYWCLNQNNTNDLITRIVT